nr:leptomycin b resistance protein pmd1 [Quercus suber]
MAILDAEKSLSQQPPAATLVSGEIDPSQKETSLDDANSSDDKADETAAEKPETEGSLKDYIRIFQYADRLDWVLYGVAFTGAIAVGAALPLMTLVFGSSTSSFNNFASGDSDPQDFTSSINHLVLYFIYLFVARFVIGYGATLCICIAATRTTRSIRKAFLESTLRQEVWHFDKHSNGSAASQVTTNGNRINQGIAEKLYTCIQGASLFFSAYIVALSVQWKLALIVMSIIPAIALVIGGCLAIDAPIESRIAHKEGDKKSILYGVLFSVQTFLVMSGTALAFWEGFRLFQSGEIDSVGTVFTVVLSVTLGATSILLVAPQFQSITNASSAAAELFTIIDKPSLLDPLSPEGIKPDSCTGEIEIRNLRFAYPTRPTAPVLHDLSLSIPAGKTTALVGPSGCGKSTLIGLLERWYQPTSGQILLDGHDVTEYNTKWLRSNIRLVQQEPVLFQGTVLENVSKGFVGEQTSLPKEQQFEMMKEACKASNAHDFIENLPEGYNTQVGERASMLSGGQRQRISIARSIISDPKVLLLDEATSALDPRAERVVQDALHRVSANKTTLIIAHKLATVMAADNIAVMTNGSVVEQGTHHELLQSNGLYAAMVRAQDLGADAGEPNQREDLDDDEEDSDDAHDGPVALQRTQSEGAPKALEKEVEELTAGTLGYSLIKCIFIMLAEHRDLYFWYIVTAVGSVIGGGTYPAQAIIFSRLIRVYTLEGSEAQDQANFYSLMFFVLALANLFAYFAIGWACNSIGQVITHRYRKEMVSRMVSFDQDFFDRPENSSGALTSKLSSVPTSLQELMSANIGLMLNVMVNIVGSSVLGIAYGWKLGLTIVFGGLTVLVIAGYVRIRLDQKLEASTGEQFAASAGLATEAVTSIRTVSLLTLESSIIEDYNRALEDIVTRVSRSLVVTLFPYALSQSVDFLIMALGFWYGSQLIASGEYTTTQFFVIFIAVVFGGQGTAQFFSYTTSITKAGLAANYILWLRTVKPKIAETDENRNNKPSGDGAIGFEDVVFRYKQRDASKVLRGITMQIEPGTYAAFVGPSGCGKSTLISLLERFYDPITGRITLNDVDIAEMSPHSYRRYMSLVQQEPPLYLGSVRDNIAIGLDYEPSEDEVQEACRQANALDFVTSLPEGLHTPCGSKGLQFSGGQRQRIAVARALIRKPRLLLLDEATSALDTHSERVVQKALDEAASSRTTIAVAHRLSTIRHANVIFVMEDGKIAEMGTHEELQRLKGSEHHKHLPRGVHHSRNLQRRVRVSHRQCSLLGEKKMPFADRRLSRSERAHRSSSRWSEDIVGSHEASICLSRAFLTRAQPCASSEKASFWVLGRLTERSLVEGGLYVIPVVITGHVLYLSSSPEVYSTTRLAHLVLTLQAVPAASHRELHAAEKHCESEGSVLASASTIFSDVRDESAPFTQFKKLDVCFWCKIGTSFKNEAYPWDRPSQSLADFVCILLAVPAASHRCIILYPCTHVAARSSLRARKFVFHFR